MCEYCGCQRIEVIAQLTAEHDLLRNLSRDLTAATDRDDLDRARRVAASMRAVLEPHTGVEERGLFPALADEFGAQVAQLVDEHNSVDAALVDLARPEPDPAWRQRTRKALTDLFEHFVKEQDDVFPAAAATLGPDDWDAVAAQRI